MLEGDGVKLYIIDGKVVRKNIRQHIQKYNLRECEFRVGV